MTARDAKSHTCTQSEDGNLHSFHLLPSPQLPSSCSRVDVPSTGGSACLPSDVSRLGEDRAAAAGSWGACSREGDHLQPKMVKPPGAHVSEAWGMRGHHEVRATETNGTYQDAEPPVMPLPTMGAIQKGPDSTRRDTA